MAPLKSDSSKPPLPETLKDPFFVFFVRLILPLRPSSFWEFELSNREAPRENVNFKKRIISGDLLSAHYHFSLQWLKKTDNVLDIACGYGYGTTIVSNYVKNVIGADLDKNTIESAIKTQPKKENT